MRPIPDEIIARLAACPPRESLWRHKKTGGLYEVIGPAIIEAGLVPGVVYADEAGQTWVRPVAEFTDGRFVEAPFGRHAAALDWKYTGKAVCPACHRSEETFSCDIAMILRCEHCNNEWSPVSSLQHDLGGES